MSDFEAHISLLLDAYAAAAESGALPASSCAKLIGAAQRETRQVPARGTTEISGPAARMPEISSVATDACRDIFPPDARSAAPTPRSSRSIGRWRADFSRRQISAPDVVLHALAAIAIIGAAMRAARTLSALYAHTPPLPSKRAVDSWPTAMQHRHDACI